jgi:hypothetical protein
MLLRYIGHDLYLYYLDLCFRNVAKALSFLQWSRKVMFFIKEWYWIQKLTKEDIYKQNPDFRVFPYTLDKTIIKAGFG